MAASISSSTHHCCKNSSPAHSNSSSSIGFHQPQKFIPYSGNSSKRLGVSLQSKTNPVCAAIHMQDGALPNNKSEIDDEDPLTKLKEVLSINNVTEKHENPIESDENGDKSTVSITVVGASGDLAKKKIFPALFALYYEDCLPEHFTIFGYARSKMTDEELRTMVSKTLTCRIDKRIAYRFSIREIKNKSNQESLHAQEIHDHVCLIKKPAVCQLKLT